MMICCVKVLTDYEIVRNLQGFSASNADRTQKMYSSGVHLIRCTFQSCRHSSRSPWRQLKGTVVYSRRGMDTSGCERGSA